MEPLHQHVFVCTQGKPEGIASCHNHGSLRVLQALERELDCQGLDEQIQVTTCGCLGLCGNGPVMITYPEGIWYRGVKEEDVPEIVDSHLRSGNVVSRLVWSNGPAMKTEISDSREHYRAMVRAKDQAGTLPDTLNEMIRSFMPSRAVLTALELDVFTAVASGASAEQVAQKIQADPRATEMLLNVLVSLRLLDKKEGRFFNTVAAARFFCEGSRDNSRGGLMHTTQLWHRWSSLTECVRAGTSVETSSREDSPVSDFIAAMDRNARERADAVVKATGIDGIKRMLDLGGGSGAYSIAFARAVPRLRSEILDRSGCSSSDAGIHSEGRAG